MNNCTIYDKTFLEDLIDQKNSIQSAAIQLDILNNLISPIEAIDNVWTPLFITKDNSHIENTLLLDKGYVSGYNKENNILGIQKFLKILNPRFNFWQTNGYMSMDWTLNRQNISYFPVYGLMCWFKKIVSSNTGKKLSEFANNTRVKLLNSPRSFVKIDEDTLYETNNQSKASSRFRNDGSIEFNYGDTGNNYVKLSTLGNNALFLDSDIFVEENRFGVAASSRGSTYSDIKIGQSRYLLWIPDGDVYSYYINFDEYMSQFPGIAPRSFCSPSLYQKYNAIYHKLTFNLRRTESFRPTHTARNYKNLAKYIATSPFIDEFSISRLSTKEIVELTNIFVNNDFPSTGIGDLQSITQCLSKISSYFSRLRSTDNDDNTRNLNNNIIYNTIGLKEKLVQKYGAKLILGGEGVITSKQPLEYGANVKIDQFSEYLVKSEVRDTILFANQSIEVGDISIDTKYAQTKSRIGLRFKQNPKVPDNIISRSDLMLWDCARPIIKYNEKINKINLVLAKSTNDQTLPEYNNVKNNDNPETCVFKYKDGNYVNERYVDNLSGLILLKVLPDILEIDAYKTAEDVRNPSDILVKKDFTCKWEKISGPPVLFINDTIMEISTQGGPQLFNIRTQGTITDWTGQIIGFESLTHGPEVYIAPYSTGRYQIKCTIISPYGTFVKIKTFYVTALNGFMSGDISNTPNDFFPKDVRGRYLAPVGASFRQAITPEDKARPPIRPDPADVAYIRDREKHSIVLNSKNLRVHTPTINSIAIYGKGLALPIATTSDIKVLNRAPAKLINNTLYYLEDYYNGPLKDGKPDLSYQYDKPSNITFRYFVGANIEYRLDKIKLERIRHFSDPKCANCFSLYSTDLYGAGSNFVRGKGSTLDGWEDGTYHYRSWGGAISKEDNETFSTTFSPPIKSYGGWDNEITNSLGISIPNHPAPGTIFPAITGRPLQYKSDKPSSDPPYLSQGYKYCLEDILPENSNKYIDFQKGVFHPQSGWIPYDSPLYSGIENLSSVLKFNIGARESYSFTGPSIADIRNDSYVYSGNNLFIIPMKFTSSIDISIAEGAQTIQEVQKCSTDGGATICRSDSPPHWDWLNQIHREYGDQAIPTDSGKAYDHGYRILRGGNAKRPELRSYNNFSPFMDELGFVSDVDNNRFRYFFPVSGPRYPPGPIPEEVLEYIIKSRTAEPDCIKDTGEQPPNYFKGLRNPTVAWKGFRNPRVLNFFIKDIEVKLNFLNYVNTKDLSIVFESKPCADEIYRISNPLSDPPRFKSPIAGGSIFVDQTIQSDFDSFVAPKDWPINPININNSGLSQYLYSLSNMNTRFIPKIINGVFTPYKDPPSNPHLYLLNQEYIQNHSFNLSITFSDHANKYNVLNDHNYNNSSGYVAANYQNIISINDMIKPSICPLGYSDQEINIHHNAVIANKLNITNNTFSKFNSKPMFDSTPRCRPRAGPGDLTTKGPNKNDSTAFTCTITLYDEHDEMLPNDNTANSQLYTNIYDFTNKISSSNIYSSLCNWELLLHFGDAKKPTAPILSSLDSYGNNEALSLIEYGKPPQYGGYSFMANLKNYKHMLPFVNINAPNIFFQDNSICETSDPILFGNIKSIPGVQFPWNAILSATYAYAGGVALGSAGGLGGVMAGIAGSEIASSIAIAEIVNFYNSQRAQEFKEEVTKDTYHQDYKRYPFGSPEKILINFSKDNVFWYKAEASIFKYSNTPILPYKKYNYIRLNKNTIPELSRFSVKVIESIKDLLDEKSIKELTIDCKTFNSINGPLTYNNISYHTDDIVDVRLSSADGTNICLDGLYFVPSAGRWISLADNPAILCEKSDYITRNHILFNDAADTEYSIFKNLNTDINQKKLIMLDGTVPFEIFTFRDVVQVSGQNIAPDALIDVNLGDQPIEYTGENPSVTPTSTQPDQPPEPIDTTPKYTTKILGKALIHKDNKPYTILKVDRLDMDKAEFISPDNNVIVIFGLSSSTDLKNNATNMYAFEKESLKRPQPEVYNTTNSRGSYGDGSYTINKNILSQIPMYNNIEKISHIFNNHKSDRLLYNKMFFTKEENENINSLKYVGASVAYPHRLTDVITLVDNNSKYIVDNPENSTTLDNLFNNSKYFSFNNVDFNNIHLTYVRNNNFRDASMVPAASGYVSIENDYEEKPSIEATDINGDPVSDEVFQNLITRLNLLENTNINIDAESNIGVNTIVATNKVIASYNLSYIYRHYEALTEYNSNKKISEFAMRVFYQERNDILKVLNETSDYQKARITLKDESTISGKIAYENLESITVLEPVLVDGITTFKENTVLKENIISINRDFQRTRHSIKPQILAKIKTFKPFDRLSLLAFQVEYDYDNDNYWINLDPHQGCSVAEELRPKVLKSIGYICRPANYTQGIYGMPLLASNNICNHRRGSTLENQEDDPNGTNYSKKSISIGDVSYDMYVYTTGEDIVNVNKDRLEKKAKDAGLPIKWKEVTIQRNYHINGNASQLDFTESYREILVRTLETYDVLLSPIEIRDNKADPAGSTEDADVFNLAGSIQRNVEDSGDDKIIPGLPPPNLPDSNSGPTSPSRPQFSEGGFGLLTLTGIRAGQSMKIYNVCNLDDINNLKIKFRKVPRQLRGVDAYSTVYRYGTNGLIRLGRRTATSDVRDPEEAIKAGSFDERFQPVLNNHMYYWKCMEIEDGKLVPSTTPLFFQLMNEMMYRTFFGSVDRIENKNAILKSQFLWEMIPYEFF